MIDIRPGVEMCFDFASGDFVLVMADRLDLGEDGVVEARGVEVLERGNRYDRQAAD